MNTRLEHTHCNHRHTLTKRLCTASLLFAGSLTTVQAFAIDRYVDPVNGIDLAGCTAIAAPCQTIDYAINQTVPGDVVNLISTTGSPATYFESGLEIPHDLTIAGSGAQNSTIDAQSLDRIFEIIASDVLIENVTLMNGEAGFDVGGAIKLREGNLVVSRSIILNSEALAGGGIAALDSAGEVTIFATKISQNNGSATGGGISCDNCDGVKVFYSAVSDNTSGGSGGGLYVEGTDATIVRSYMQRNNADTGGAVYLLGGLATIISSELTENEADSLNGGAVLIAGTLNVQLTTMASNTSANEGGAVYATDGSTVLASNSTFSNNEALVGGAFGLDPGFGPNTLVRVGASTFFNNESTFPGASEHIFGGWNSFIMFNTIMTNDPGALVAPGPSCNTAMTGGAHNMIDDATCNGPALSFNLGAVNGFDLDLAYNGGITRTHQLLAGSNAIEAGANWGCRNPATLAFLVADQRGRPRPVDADLNGTATCDIGAYEMQ